MSSDTRSTIVEAARRLFGERGYTAVTIKDVAVEAGYSPAMVMKVMGSKAQLYAAAAPALPPAETRLPADEPVGYGLVRTIMARRDEQAAEPWAMALFLIQDAPDPEAARAKTRDRYLHGIAARIGDTSPGLRRANLVVCMLLGLAGGMRTLGLLGTDVADSESVIRQYGALVQALIDGE